MSYRLANAGGRAALVLHGGLYDLEQHTEGAFSSEPMAAVARHLELHAVAERMGAEQPDSAVDESRLGPPVPAPQKIFGIGLNYRDHAAEADLEVPDVPIVFTKFPSSLTGPTGDVVVWGPSTDWEAELVVVIGTGGRDIAEHDAWAHVAGVMCGQDISERRTQMAGKPPQFSMGKSYDTFAPTGPTLVSVDSLADPDDLAISCHVNGERKQHARTSQLIFTVPELIAYLSSVTTMVPGDLIFTGTPSGVGAVTGTFLQPGDTLTTTIESVGTLTNHCVSPPAASEAASKAAEEAAQQEEGAQPQEAAQPEESGPPQE
jgi:2,4-didehydro-3-deoxy-L-rhamnonate hydrolase